MWARVRQSHAVNDVLVWEGTRVVVEVRRVDHHKSRTLLHTAADRQAGERVLLFENHVSDDILLPSLSEEHDGFGAILL